MAKGIKSKKSIWNSFHLVHSHFYMTFICNKSTWSWRVPVQVDTGWHFFIIIFYLWGERGWAGGGGSSRVRIFTVKEQKIVEGSNYICKRIQFFFIDLKRKMSKVQNIHVLVHIYVKNFKISTYIQKIYNWRWFLC